MLAAILHGPNDLRLDELPEPEPADHDVVVRVAACGICGSDLGYVAAGGLGAPGGSTDTRAYGAMPLGHEIAGIVARAGAAVHDVKEGDHVIVNPMAGGNVIGNGGPEGGLAPLLLVRDAVRTGGVLPIAAHVPFTRAALAEPLGVALHAVNRAAPHPDDRVVVLGAGSIGLGVVFWLRRRGVRDVVVADLSAARREAALQLGARIAFDPRAQPLHAALAAAHGSGDVFGWPVVHSDVYIDTAGAASLVGDFIASAKAGARLVVVALHHTPVAVDFRLLLAKELTITSAIGYPTELPEVVATLASDAGAEADALVSHVVDWPDVATAFALARDATAARKVVVRFGA
jgi:2-desacetyl-2-hydroxyethyl bacteriochlorophyllide A dehydrogenase